MSKSVILMLLLCTLSLIMFRSVANSAEPLTIKVRPTSSLMAGQISDGTRIAIVQFTYNGKHKGFRAWINTQHSAMLDNTYTVRGLYNSDNILRVRIQKNNARYDNESAGGVLIFTPNYQSTFSVVAHGNQKIKSDRYLIELNGSVIFI
ncbi:AfaD family invasin [Lelliottia sp. SL45]|uniref:AfaD family invasin n=1 Tax=Lelliottia sp. SL45 TaxID=2994665 RepID=UPI003FA3D3A1